jgi:hypothetical protein
MRQRPFFATVAGKSLKVKVDVDLGVADSELLGNGG